MNMDVSSISAMVVLLIRGETGKHINKERYERFKTYGKTIWGCYQYLAIFSLFLEN